MWESTIQRPGLVAAFKAAHQVMYPPPDMACMYPPHMACRLQSRSPCCPDSKP